MSATTSATSTIQSFESIAYEAEMHPAALNYVPFSGNFPSTAEAHKDVVAKILNSGYTAEDIAKHSGWSTEVVDSKLRLWKYVVKMANSQKDHFEMFAQQYENSH